jgi:hypothetical protein
VEVDYASIATTLRATTEDKSKLWSTYEEARRILRNFNDHHIVFIRRESM